MNRSGLRPARWLAPVFGLGLVATSLLLATGGRAAAELLENGGFEEWAGSAPSGWSAGGQVTRVSSPSVSGQAASLASGANLRRTVAVQAGAAYAYGVSASSPGSATAELMLRFLDGGLVPLSPTGAAKQQPVGTGFTRLSGSTVAPAGAAYATLTLTANGGVVVFDNASLLEEAPPPPTNTPEPTDTPAPSPTATPAKEKSATATPTPPRPTNTPKQATAAATRTPTSPGGGPSGGGGLPPPRPGGGGGVVAPPAAGGSGGLLVNGDFEMVADGAPAFWSKVGGVLAAVEAAHGGSYSASLLSSTSSTKWVYQVVAVTPGSWYAASVFALLPSSGGEAFLRISWYAESDGGGTAIEQLDTEPTAAASWSLHSTGAIQAPAAALSVRFRLMLRPDGPSAALFDDARFVEVAAPAGTPAAAPSATATPTSPVGGAATSSPTVRSSVAEPSAAVGGATKSPTAQPRGGGSQQSGTRVEFASGPATLRLSEVMADPEESGRDAPFEWVELYNAGSEPVDLAGWKIADSKTADVLPAMPVAPGVYVVVAARSATFTSGVTVVRVADGEIGSGLNNGGETVRLIAPGGDEVDALSFGTDTSVFDPPPTAPEAGVTLGAVRPGSDPAAENWAVTERPTPGEPNVFRAKVAATPVRSTPTVQARGAAPPAGPGDPSTGPTVREASGSGSWLPYVVVGVAAGVGGAVGLPYVIRAGKRLKRGD